MKTQYIEIEKCDYIQVGALLKKGEIIAFPTDTVYGLGAVFSDVSAVRKIFEAKGRDEGKPLSILISDIDQADILAEGITEEARTMMKDFWPGALTLIFKKKDCVPDVVSAGGDTIGLRMPADERIRRLIREAGAPLAAPSANTSGKRSSVTADDVREDLDGKIPVVIDGGACPVGLSSTVVDMSVTPAKILREGSITKEMLSKYTDIA